MLEETHEGDDGVEEIEKQVTQEVKSETKKRSRITVTNMDSPKRRKLTKTSFMSSAPKLKFKLDDDIYYVEPTATKEGFGWANSGKHKVEFDGRQLTVNWNLNLTIEDEGL